MEVGFLSETLRRMGMSQVGGWRRVGKGGEEAHNGVLNFLEEVADDRRSSVGGSRFRFTMKAMTVLMRRMVSDIVFYRSDDCRFRFTSLAAKAERVHHRAPRCARSFGLPG